MNNIFCPACGNSSAQQIYERLNKEKGLLKCLGCGLYFIWPAAKKTFACASNYYASWPRQELNSDSLEEMKIATFERVMDAVSRYKNSGDLLDVGCAFGHLMKVAKGRGWNVYGIDSSGFATEAARKMLDTDNIETGNFMDFSAWGRSFDVVTMMDSLEHIYEVSPALEKCRKVLKDKGLLVILTPDIQSFSRRCLQKLWPHFNEDHVVFFSQSAAKKILGLNGFKVLSAQPFKKVFNMNYLQAQVRMHCHKIIDFFTLAIAYTLPAGLKKQNFLLSHGEILVIAEKSPEI